MIAIPPMPKAEMELLQPKKEKKSCLLLEEETGGWLLSGELEAGVEEEEEGTTSSLTTTSMNLEMFCPLGKSQEAVMVALPSFKAVMVTS